MIVLRRLLVLAALVALPACDEAAPIAPSPTPSSEITIPDADLPVLFIGNSLIATNEGNDIPRFVGELAGQAGLSYAQATVTEFGWSLKDHWDAGVARTIEKVGADVVVLQQGPTISPYERSRLIEYAEKLAPVIRAAGGEPALLMVWPERGRPDAFTEVRQSYQAAAAAVDGIFIPAGETWPRAWAMEPDFEMWGPDWAHPTYLGSLAAAMATYAVLFDVDAAAIPDLPDDAVPEQEVATLRSAVDVAIVP